MNKQKITKTVLQVIRNIVILALTGNALALINFPLKFWTIESFISNSIISVLIGYPAAFGITLIGAFLDRKIPWLKNPVKRLVVQSVSMIFFAAIIMISGMLIWIGLSDEITIHTINTMVIKALLAGLAFLILSMIVVNAILFFKNWKMAAVQQEELKRAHLALQYQTLKDQVKPHFLFNSLSSLVTLINTDTEKATLFVHKLSDVYRYLLEQKDNELVSISEEMKFTDDYIFLQQIRFGDNLQVNSVISPDKHRMVLPLSIQMMVENAIKHNEVSSEHPLVIDIFAGVDDYIIIKNKLHKKVLVEHSLRLGLENMKKRTSFFTSNPIIIEEGTEDFVVKIPTIRL